MKNLHLQEGQYYLIQNHAVACNPIFLNAMIIEHFKDKMFQYLEPVCRISAYGFTEDSFSMVVCLKSREEFEEFYEEKYGVPHIFRPAEESTYIFSRQMSNLQVSLVKKVNYHFDRSGTLIAGRFKRILLESPEDVMDAISMIHKNTIESKHSGIWKNKMKTSVDYVSSLESYRCFREGSLIEKLYYKTSKKDLVDHFDKPLITCNFPTPIFHKNKYLVAIGKFAS